MVQTWWPKLTKAQNRRSGSKHISDAVSLCPSVAGPIGPVVPWTNLSFHGGTISDIVLGVIGYVCSTMKIHFSFLICLLRQWHLCLADPNSLPEHISNTGGNFVHDKELRVSQHSTGLIYEEGGKKNKKRIPHTLLKRSSIEWCFVHGKNH